MSDPRFLPENHREECAYRKAVAQQAQTTEPIQSKCTCGLLRAAPKPEKPLDGDPPATTMP